MIQCNDCKIEHDCACGWYADFTDKDKIMRCPSCGEKEKERRWKYYYGDRELKATEDCDKQDRIQNAKDLRDAGLSPWQYRKEF